MRQAANKALHWIAIPQGSIAAGELGRSRRPQVSLAGLISRGLL